MELIAEKKKAIFEGTLELIKEHGFHGTPMSQVAKQAGVAAGTIYHYFESKEKLICELYTYIQQQVVSLVRTEMESEAAFPDSFLNLWFTLYHHYRQNPNVLKFFEQFTNSPYSALVYESEPEQNEFYQLLISFFERGLQEGQLKPISTRMLAILFHSNIISTAKVQALDRYKLPDEELKQIPQVLWDGIRKS